MNNLRNTIKSIWLMSRYAIYKYLNRKSKQFKKSRYFVYELWKKHCNP